jgi:hypothetical protein
MSYYFVIVGTQDNPLFEHEFGTSKAGGDGQARFPEQARHMNQFIVHSSLDIVEEVQWGTGQMYVINALSQNSDKNDNRPRKLMPTVSLKVFKVHRPFLQQLRLLFSHRRKRKIYAPPPAALLCILYNHESTLLDFDHCREPYEPAD